MNIKKNIVLTGASGIGKSTLLRQVLQEFDGKWTGLFGVRLFQEQRLIGYALQQGSQPEAHVFAWEDLERSVFGRYRIDLQPFKSAAAFIRRSMEESFALFVIDEFGAIERSCADYCAAVKELLLSPVRTCLVVQQRALPFLDALCPECTTVFITLDPDDRQAAAERLKSLLNGSA